MKKLLIAILVALAVLIACKPAKGEEPTNLAELALDSVNGVVLYVPTDKAMALGGRFELARSGIPGLTNYKILTAGLVAGFTFIDEEESARAILFGPDLGLAIPEIVKWAGGEWPHENITASLTAGLPFDLRDSKFKFAVIGALVTVAF